MIYRSTKCVAMTLVDRQHVLSFVRWYILLFIAESTAVAHNGKVGWKAKERLNAAGCFDPVVCLWRKYAGQKDAVAYRLTENLMSVDIITPTVASARMLVGQKVIVGIN